MNSFLTRPLRGLLLLAAVAPLQANESPQASPPGSTVRAPMLNPDLRSDSPPERFTEDRITLGATAGFAFSPIGIGPDHDSFNYSLSTIRLGWMLNSPARDGSFLDGNFEAILELSGSAITNDWGTVLIGPTALVRYNFVQPDWPVVPYIQAGAGIIYTDAHEDPSQDEIGQAIEFTPQASIGLRILAGRNWSIETEAIFHHISNASLSPQNDGTNAVGGMIGATYYFDRLWK